jgi:CRISPR system Cascade subunit CasB
MSDWREGFVRHLEDLRDRNDRAALATLRRGLKDRPELNFDAARYVYPWLPPKLYAGGLENALLVASLFALHPARGGKGGVGSAVRRIKDKSGSIEKRFSALVDSDRDALTVKLRYMTTLLKSNNVPVDWLQVLKDLSSWEHQDRFVQRRWVSEFYGVKEEE